MIIKYLKYIITHKWYVFIECCKLGIPFLGIIHDLSKLSPSEFMQYARNFHAKRTNKVETEFKYAWLNHQNHNKHHWQYWILIYDTDPNKVICLDIPIKYRKEMLADWIGAGKAITGGDNLLEWYRFNRDKIIMHPGTRTWIENQINKRNT